MAHGTLTPGYANRTCPGTNMCVIMPPLCPNRALSLLPGFVISQGLNCPFLIINHDTLQIKGLAKNPYYHIWAPGYLAIMFMS